MKNRWGLLGLLLLWGTGLGAQEAPARIFAVNLFALPIDVQWGDEGTFQALNLGPRGVAPARSVAPGLARTVLFRRVGSPAWSAAKDAEGEPKAVALEAGGLYVLVVKANGNGDLVKVAAAATGSPKVQFFNAARGPVAKYSLGAKADGLGPGWTEFVDAPLGPATLTWAWPTMPPGYDKFEEAGTQPGQPAVWDLQPGRWYVAVVSAGNGNVTDITPAE